MLLGIVKRRPNEDVLLPREAVAADVCVGDPGHGSGKNTEGGPAPQINMRNTSDQLTLHKLVAALARLTP
jgi:hypothetical protein